MPPGNTVVTLRDIARAVGVSPSAVSMALADHPRISAATKSEVRLAADRLGYVANSAARALRAKRADTIALVVPHTVQHVFGHAYFMHLLVGVTSISNSRDSFLVVSTNSDERHGVAAFARVLRSGAADGIIVASAAINDQTVQRLVEAALPVVLVGRAPHLSNAASVGVDDIAGAVKATRHLLVEHGARRIGHISGPLEHQSAVDRYDGFRSAIAEYQEPCVQGLAVGDFSEDAGRVAVGKLFDIRSDWQAIFAANDEMAYGALLELRRRGIRVPEDVALVGYDDFGMARITTPALTTVRVPAEELGRRATEQLFNFIHAPPLKRTQTVLPVDLVVRESCGCGIR